MKIDSFVMVAKQKRMVQNFRCYTWPNMKVCKSTLLRSFNLKQQLTNSFLVATKRLYMRVCPSVRRSVRRSVGPSVRPSVGRSDGRMVRNLFFFSNAKNGQFSSGKSSGQSKFDIAECA